MGKLVLITPEGLILSNNEPRQVEVKEVEPLHIIAAREHAKYSNTAKKNQQA